MASLSVFFEVYEQTDDSTDVWIFHSHALLAILSEIHEKGSINEETATQILLEKKKTFLAASKDPA